MLLLVNHPSVLDKKFQKNGMRVKFQFQRTRMPQPDECNQGIFGDSQCNRENLICKRLEIKRRGFASPFFRSNFYI